MTAPHTVQAGASLGEKLNPTFKRAHMTFFSDPYDIKLSADDLDEKGARHEKGKSVDPTKDMSPEDAAEWKKQTEKNKDKFKKKSYFSVVLPPGGLTKWHDPRRTLTRGSFTTKREADAWANKNIPGDPYTVRWYDDPEDIEQGMIEVARAVSKAGEQGVRDDRLPTVGVRHMLEEGVVVAERGYLYPKQPQFDRFVKSLRGVRLANGDDDVDEKGARHEKGKSVDPTKDMSPEDAAEWKKQTEKNKDKFKNAADDVDEKGARHEKGKSVDPTKDMSPEDAAEWKKQTEKNKDKFKSAAKTALKKGRKVNLPSGVTDMDGKSVPRGAYTIHNVDSPSKGAMVTLGSMKDPTKRYAVPRDQVEKASKSAAARVAIDELALMELSLVESGIEGVPLDRSLQALKQVAALDAVNRAANSQVGKIIHQQMGGRRLNAMLGIYYLQYLPNGMEFGFPNKQRSKGNHVKITLRGDDTYTVEFLNTKWMRVGRNRLPAKSKSIKKLNGVYADQLTSVFEKQTGWYTRLASDSAAALEELRSLEAQAVREGTFTEGSRIPDGWDSGYIEDDPDATESSEGSEIPDGSGNIGKRAQDGIEMHALVLNGGLLGATDNWRDASTWSYWSHGDRKLVSDDQRDTAVVVDLYGVPLPVAEQLMDVGTRVSRLNPQAALRLAKPYIKGQGHKVATRALGGLYGSTKRIQADCEISIRKLQREATRVANRIYGKNQKVAGFLKTHAERSDSLPARILMAALEDMGPKFADEMKRMARLAELRMANDKKLEDTQHDSDKVHPGQSHEDWEAEQGKTAARGKAQKALAAYVSGWKKGDSEDLTDIARHASFRGIHFAKVMSAAEALKKAKTISFDGVTVRKAKVSDADAQTGEGIKQTTDKTAASITQIFKKFPSKYRRESKDGKHEVHWKGKGWTTLEELSKSNLDKMWKALSYEVGGGEVDWSKLGSDKTAAGSGSSNAAYLDGLPPRMKAKILRNVADHYGVSVSEIEIELKDRDAEALYEYIANDNALRMQVYRDFKSKRLASDKEARVRGLYGYSDKVADLGLNACGEVRGCAGRISFNLHSRRSAKHAGITAFLDSHCKKAKCLHSRLLAASYPSADTKVAALQPPRTVEAWLAWED